MKSPEPVFPNRRPAAAMPSATAMDDPAASPSVGWALADEAPATATEALAKDRKLVKVVVQDLAGTELEESIGRTETVLCVREIVAKAWNLNPRSLNLMSGTMLLADDAELASLGEEPIKIQVMKSLHELGEFDGCGHAGIEIRSGGSGKDSVLVKTSDRPDSNNVFLRYPIHEPCFVEFQIVRSSDELSVGVSYAAEMVAKRSGFSNLELTNTSVYSKKQSMPVFLFGGREKNPRGQRGIQQGDLVAVYADPAERVVRFYSNGCLVGQTSKLPPPRGRALRIYVMVDAPEDEVSVLRYGAGPYSKDEPYSAEPTP